MARGRLKILHEDNHLLVVDKPAGLATMGAEQGVTTVLDLAKDYLREKHNKPGKVYLGVVSRLDAPVTGVLCFARTSKAAGRLTEAFKTHRVEKTYLATVTGAPPESDEPLVHFVKKDERNRRMFVTHDQTPGAQRAELRYEVLMRRRGVAMLRVHLMTGRKHQIRVQLAKLGYPILGDGKYGGDTAYQAGIALHALRLKLEHPVRREPITLTSQPPKGWGRWRPEELSPAPWAG